MESLDREQLLSALREVGLQGGDVVLVHSRLHGAGRVPQAGNREELCRFFLDALLEVVGPAGTLVVPTFTTQVARYDEPFVPEQTVPNYGLLPAYVFNRPEFVRSLHPLESMAATGPQKEEICRKGGFSSYGARSPMDMLVRMGAKNLFIGLEIKEAANVVHYIEMRFGVPYVYNKLLKWRPIIDGRTSPSPHTASVRYLEYDIRWSLDRYQADLVSRGQVRSARVGGGSIHLARLEDMVETGFDGLEKDIYYFLAKPPDFDYGRLPFDGPTGQREQARNPEASGTNLAKRDLLDDKTMVNVEALFGRSPRFAEILTALSRKHAAGVRKTLTRLAEVADEQFMDQCEELARLLLDSAGRRGSDALKVADAYLQFCADTAREQMEFRHSRTYSNSTYRQAHERVYARDRVMDYYMDGLLLSQLLWDNHRRLLRFARGEFFAPFCATSRHHVEVGPGHGWFTHLALQFGAGKVIAYDVSPESLRHTASLLEEAGYAPDRYELHQADVQTHIPLDDQSVDTLAAGEVLEHIADPGALLGEIRRVLRPGGAAYITTATNAPAIDHLYLFRNTDEIRRLIERAGLSIERDLAVEAGRIAGDVLENYAAVLIKQG